jgi:predicted dehydrogenase/threonine dehydrogenase-like Zn-dependent dehydrogenase
VSRRTTITELKRLIQVVTEQDAGEIHMDALGWVGSMCRLWPSECDLYENDSCRLISYESQVLIMQQVIENLKTGKVQLVDTPVPSIGAGDVLVKNRVSLISPGTEKLMIEMGQKNLVGKAMARPDLFIAAYQKAKREGFLSVFREAMARLDQPLPLGYSCAGEVIEVGREVGDLRPGARVACAGSAFASHAQFVAVPQSLCVELPGSPDGRELVSYEDASFVMLGGIALQGIRTADLTFGESVVVVGLGLIGLLTVQIAKAYGCRVFGVDVDAEKVRLAKQLGCDSAFVSGTDDVDSAIANLTAGSGADAVILTAATKDNAPVLLAERVARKRGRIVLVGVSDLTLTRKAFWDKELRFTVSRASGPSALEQPRGASLPAELVRWTEHENLTEFVRLLAARDVDVSSLITHRFSIDEAPSAYEMILESRQRYIGVLITYPLEPNGTANAARTVRLAPPTLSSSSRVSIGLIGAGMFTKNVFLPALKKVTGLRLVGVAAKTGLNSRHVGNRFGFETATSDSTSLIQDATIGSIIITTRHDSHAGLVVESLRAGKNVFVEKPLCLTHEELQSVIEAFAILKNPPMFMVGFNRRYAPLSQRLKTFVDGRTTPLVIQYRVNAGFIQPDHWTQDPSVGGGRIIGEACHMVDFLQFLTGATPVAVAAQSIGGETGKYTGNDNVSFTVTFSDGSLGTILYTALGSKVFSRERIEVFCGDSVAILDDFRVIETIRGGRRDRKKLMSQSMGYIEELNEFFHGSPASSVDHFWNAVATTLTTFAVERSLRTREVVRIAVPERPQ